ncbi:PepSY-like domain-containing protein [Winogradskyella litorisediminis]|uniref:PepSY-like domain-containing protein n=1 Tax=Winogradskyella litorisediminis TaxID=1156618 RepID=A0ABW3N653_9FLAO
MKRLMHLNIICLFIFTVSCNLKSYAQIPDAVKTSFKAKYPDEKPDNWEIDDHGNYEFHFKKNGEKMRADFLKTGKWIETEISIDKDELPKAIKKVIKEKFDDEDITEVEKVMHHSKGLFYDVEFKKKGKNKDVMFKTDGSIIH